MAQYVDGTRDSARHSVNPVDRRIREQIRASFCRLQAMGSVLCSFLPFERFQVVVDRDPLGQRGHGRAFQPVFQLRLADQHDLQQHGAAVLEVGQQTDFLQRIQRQALGLVDDEQGTLVPGTQVDQKSGESFDGGGFVDSAAIFLRM
jgi:hypothetical protein